MILDLFPDLKHDKYQIKNWKSPMHSTTTTCFSVCSLYFVIFQFSGSVLGPVYMYGVCVGPYKGDQVGNVSGHISHCHKHAGMSDRPK